MAIVTETVNTTAGFKNGGYVIRDHRVRAFQRPYVEKKRPLPYRLNCWRAGDLIKIGLPNFQANADTVFSGDNAYLTSSNVTSSLEGMDQQGKAAYNRAYAKFYELVKAGNVDLGALVAERVEAYQMIKRRMDNILDYAEYGVHGDARRLANKLRIPLRDVQSQIRRARKKLGKAINPATGKPYASDGVLSTSGGAFLEVYWGWMPAVADIATAFAHWGLPIPTMSVHASAGYPINAIHRGGTRRQRTVRNARGKFRIKIGGQLSAYGAWQHEAARLGATNMSQSLYEIIPGSWLIDWFTSVGQIVESWDDSLEVSVSDLYVTRFAKATEDVRAVVDDNTPRVAGWQIAGLQRVIMTRDTPKSLPHPFFVYHLPDVTWKRVAVVASLLVLRLKRIQRLSSSYF